MDMTTISNIIFNQLGGQKFVVMTGAKYMVSSENGLTFQIGKNASKANLVKVTVNANDTYNLQFWNKGKEINSILLMVKYFQQGLNDEQIRIKVAEAEKKAEPKMLKEYSGIYSDQLQELFTEYTKMYTKLF